MKQIGRITIFILITITAIVSNKNTVYAQNSNRVKLSFNTHYNQYDITEDGVADEIYLSTYYMDEDQMLQTGLTIYVNSRIAYIDGETVFFNEKDGDNWVQCELLTLSNGKELLYLYLGIDNGDGPINVYEYKNGYLVEIADIYKDVCVMGYHTRTYITKVSNNKIYFKINSESFALAGVNIERVYVYKNGKLVANDSAGLVKGYYKYTSKGAKYGKKYLTIKKSVKLFKDKKCKKQKGTLKVGDKVKVLKYNIMGKRCTYYVKKKNGKAGWIQSKKKPMMIFKEVIYAG